MANNQLPHDAARMSIAEQYEWFKNATSRRSLLRGGLVGAGAIAAGGTLLADPAAAAGSASSSAPATSGGLLASASRPSGAFLAPFGRHVAFGADPATSFTVCWQVPAAVKKPFVRIGRSPFDLGEKVEAELQVLSTPWGDVSPLDSVPLAAPTSVEQYYVQARISHLMPGTTYFYVVGHDGYDPAARPALEQARSFTTAPGRTTAFTFTAFGDQGESYDAVATGNLVRSQNPSFHLHAGDLSYANDGGSGQLSNPYDPRAWDSFFVQNEGFASTVPWQAVVGNHEMERDGALVLAERLRRLLQALRPAGREPVVLLVHVRQRRVPRARRQRRDVRIHRQQRLHRRRADQVADPPTGRVPRPAATSTSSSRTSTSAPTAPPPPTPRTAACARPGRRCSTSTRSTW